MMPLGQPPRSWSGVKGFAHRSGVTPDHDKVGAGGGVGSLRPCSQSRKVPSGI